MTSKYWRSQIFEKNRNRKKNNNKKLAARIWVKWAKIRTKTRFFCHFLRFGSLVFLENAYNDNLQQFLTSSRGKSYEKKNFLRGGANLGQRRQFCHFLKSGSLVFLEIAYNDSLQQFPASYRDKIHKKNFRDQIWEKTGQNWTQN